MKETDGPLDLTFPIINHFPLEELSDDFDMFSKIPVTGSAKVELYKFLTSRSSSPFPGEVAWNFEKFLVGRDGKIINRFKSRVEPESRTMIGAIEAALD